MYYLNDGTGVRKGTHAFSIFTIIEGMNFQKQDILLQIFFNPISCTVLFYSTFAETAIYDRFAGIFQSDKADKVSETEGETIGYP